MHDTTRRPLIRTVQAPHWPWSHPFFVPVRPMCSRSASSTAVRASMVRGLSAPLIRRVTFTGNDASFTVGESTAAPAAMDASGGTAVPAAVAIILRRLKPDVV